jgi:hypothetical protein
LIAEIRPQFMGKFVGMKRPDLHQIDFKHKFRRGGGHSLRQRLPPTRSPRRSPYLG